MPRARNNGPNSGRYGAFATVAPPNFTNSPLIDRLHAKRQDVPLHGRRGGAGAGKQSRHRASSVTTSSIADTDILRTSSGSVALGVNTGLVQGTPGGPRAPTSRGRHRNLQPLVRTGGGAGGTTIGVGGAGCGCSRYRFLHPRRRPAASTISIRSLPAPEDRSARHHAEVEYGLHRYDDAEPRRHDRATSSIPRDSPPEP